jgi:hypothetical protein
MLGKAKSEEDSFAAAAASSRASCCLCAGLLLEPISPIVRDNKGDLREYGGSLPEVAALMAAFVIEGTPTPIFACSGILSISYNLSG